MRVLVTGASGFVARHVIAALEAAGDVAIAAYHTPGNVPVAAPSVILSVEDSTAASAAILQTQAEAIVNCAAYAVDHRQQDLATAVATNVLGPAQLFTAACEAGVTRFVHVGTGYEYGSRNEDLDEDAAFCPSGIYGSTKAAGSIVLSELGRRLGSAPVIVRPFSMYGPGENASKLVPQVVAAMRMGSALNLTDGSQLRDYLPVMDVARGIATLATLPDTEFPTGELFNICSGRPITIRQFATDIAEAAGGAGVLNFGALPSRSDGPFRVVGNPSRWQAFWRAKGAAWVSTETPMATVVQAMLEESRG